MAKEKNEALGTTDFLDQVAGEGFEGIGKTELSIPYLYLVQEQSPAEVKGLVKPGNFMNTVTREDYGKSVKVIVCGFKVVWTEKDKIGRTVSRYEVGDIAVEGNVYDGMINPETKNKVIETWMYQLVLPEHPEAGFMIYASTPGNIRNLKGWNTQMKFLRLPSGKPAAIYACIWEITAGQDVSRDGKEYFSFKNGIQKVGFIDEAIYSSAILPARQSNVNLIAAPDTTPVDPSAEVTDY